jgi:DtxR family transcriptional regulator, Mn-dependent transcriptional regulator
MRPGVPRPDPVPASPAAGPAVSPAAGPAVSPAVQDYLKAVWSAGEWSTAPVTTKKLAERLGVGAPTVSEMVRRLCDQGLLTHVRYGAVGLTPAGRAHAVATVRRHRLVETFLVSELGYSWDEVHDEAEVLEHAVSDLLVDRIDARLGHPTRDPHGDPIPAPDGTVPQPPARPLGELPPGAWAVARISDADPDLLRFFDSAGIGLDVVVRVVGPAPDGGVRLLVGDDELELGARPAAAVWLVATRAADGGDAAAGAGAHSAGRPDSQ